MLYSKSVHKGSFFLAVFALLLMLACQEKSLEIEAPIPEIVAVDTISKDTTAKDSVAVLPTKDELIKDSIYLYAKQVYYWYDAIPDINVFQPRSFTSYSEPISNYESELFKITQYKINPSTGFPYEYVSASAGYPKYSYISDVSQQSSVAFIKSDKLSVDLNNIGNDFGLRLSPYGTTSNYKLYIQAVYPNSPADKAGLKRGDYISSINGTSIGSNYSAEYDIFYTALFESSRVNIGGRKRNNTNFSNVTLNKVSYSSTPFLKDSVYIIGTRKVGYIAYARFANPSTSQPAFNAIFSKFKDSGVTDLVIDLRYNGGGYVSTAEYLVNLIAPPSLNGQVMFTEYYNQLMQQNYSRRNSNPTAPLLSRQYILDAYNNKSDYNNDGKWDTYADIDFSAANNVSRFSKKGSLNSINKIAIIATRSTASASELVINALKPHFNSDIKVVGDRSYGKPIGFFPIRIDNYDVYYSMFETKNSSGTGGYFDGFTPDIPSIDLVNNGTNYDMWDRNDPSLSAALDFINSTTLNLSSTKNRVLTSASVLKSLSVPGKDLEDVFFKGMIENRFKVK